MSIEQEKMIVEALPSLYSLQEFEEKAIDTVLNAIPHWIPVTEKLPKVGREILFCDIDGDIFVGHRAIEHWWSVDDKVKNVTAWMPLPEPYKGVNV